MYDLTGSISNNVRSGVYKNYLTMKDKLKKVYAPYYQSPKQFEGYFKNLHLMARIRKIVYGINWIKFSNTKKTNIAQSTFYQIKK